MRSYRSTGQTLLGALLVSAAVHLPVYAVLGVLAGGMPEGRARPSAAGVPFEVAEIEEEGRPEDRARPGEPEAPADPRPPDRAEKLRKPQRAEKLAERPAPPQERKEPGTEAALPVGENAVACANAVSLDSTVEEGAVAVPAAREGGGAAPAFGGSSQGPAGLGATAGRARGGVSGADRPAVPLVRVEPRYPLTAARNGVEGWVRLRFDISPTGTVDNPVVIEAHPPGVFERAVLKAIKGWKYRPMIRNGVAVRRGGVKVRLTFKLDRQALP